MLSLQFVPRGFAAREPFHPFNGRSEFALRQGFAAQNACGGALAPADETREAACIASRFFFGAGYGNRTRLLGLGSRCTTDVLTLQSEAIIADFPAQCKAKFACRHSFPYMPPAGGIGWGKGHKKECIP